MNSETITKLSKIFAENNWVISPENEWQDIFNSFCSTLSKLSQEQQDLILDLTKKYLKFEFNILLPSLIKLLKNTISNHFNDINTLYILPLITKGDIGKTKSSMFFLYMLKSSAFKINPLFYSKNIHLIDSIQPALANLSKSNSQLLLLDDFIGTGETAVKAINELSQENIEISRTSIITLVAQKSGIKYINEIHKDLKIYCLYERNKGITDHYESPVKEKFIETMKSIETLLGVNSGFNFGYGQSEALVTIHRTPNNTFPIFWLKKNDFSPPFPR